MEEASVRIRSSLSYKVIYACWTVFRQSVSCRVLAAIGGIIRESSLSLMLSRFFKKRYSPEEGLFYWISLKIKAVSMPLREKTADIVQKSATSSLLTHSIAYRFLSRFLIPAAVFFVLIDAFARGLFGSSRWVGYWDEIYLLLCVICLFFIRLSDNRRTLRAATPLDAPIFLLIAVSLALYLTHSVYPAIAFEGMRAVVEFILWYFVFSFFLDSDEKAYLLLKGLVLTGGILGCYGAFQAVIGVNTPSSWTDFAEGTKSARVYSFVGSPNILGSIMVLIIPIALACAVNKKVKRSQRIIALLLAATMGICLILTLSRGAWIGMAVGLFIFCIAYDPRWLIGMGFAGGLTFLVPPVANRIRYMLSPLYIANSLVGGRLMRYQTGWRMFTDNLWLGVGLGHFGGAVAMNHKNVFPNTFYMDNYWLKTAVEMGLAGLSAFFLLMSFLIIWSIRGIRNMNDKNNKVMAIGGLSGMSGIIVHNFFENVFEVPYMVVYFWLIAAIVMYFGFRSPHEEQ